jgi:hypothetical protein
MSAREFLWIVKESALNTLMASPVAGTDSIYIRLVDGNSFSMVAEPVIEEIPYGGGLAVTAEAISDHYACKGSLKTKLYPSQAPFLLAAAITRINTGQTAPWTTTEPAGDLASFSVYHAVRRADGTYKRHLYSGCKVAGWKIEVSRGGTTAMLTLDLQACKSAGNSMDSTSDPDATAFPAPAETDYPTGPYTFANTAGGMTIATVRTQYEDLAIAGQNVLDGRWFETAHLSINQFCGRSTTLDTTLYLKATPDDRAAYEAITAKAASVVLASAVTGETTTIQFNGQNRIKSLPYDLPLNQAFMQKLSLKNLFDPSATGDVSVSFA